MYFSFLLTGLSVVCNVKEVFSFYGTYDKMDHRNSLLYSTSIPSLKGVPYKINQIVQKNMISSIRLRHIELSSEELANECKYILSTNTNLLFEQLARDLSQCSLTKNSGGDFGWILISDGMNHIHESSVPPELVNSALHMNRGDIKVIRSQTPSITDGNKWHVVQLMDVVKKLSPILQRRKMENFKSLRQTDVETEKESPTYAIETMGCQMNIADSERIEGNLKELGYSRTDDSAKANLIVFNTCSIRDHAEQKVYSYIGPHALRKRRGDDVSIVVAGCVAQQEGVSIVKWFPEVDIVMGPQYANRISDLLEASFNGGIQVVATDPSYQTEDTFDPVRKSEIVAYVNVIYGCNER